MPGAVIGADCNVCDHTYVEDDVVVDHPPRGIDRRRRGDPARTHSWRTGDGRRRRCGD
jgi:hypothetical protein